MKILNFIILALLFMSFAPKERNYVVKGTLTNIPSDESVSLSFYDPVKHAFVEEKSIYLRDSIFEFKGTISYPTYALLNLPNDIKHLLILDNDTISISCDLNQATSLELKGNKENTELNNFQIAAHLIEVRIDKYQEDYKDLMQKAIKDKNISAQNKILNIYRDLGIEYKKLLSTQLTQDTTYNAAIALYQSANGDISPRKAQKHFDRLPKEIQMSNIGESIQNTIDMYKSMNFIGEGDKVVFGSGKNTIGKPVSLLDNLGKVTIIHFWASWSRPDRYQNIDLVTLYANYHKKGLNIISISLDKEYDKWVTAIKEDKMTWVHISNLQYWDEPIAKAYGITAIPTMFIVNKQGIIVEVLNNTDEMESIINELLK